MTSFVKLHAKQSVPTFAAGATFLLIGICYQEAQSKYKQLIVHLIAFTL